MPRGPSILLVLLVLFFISLLVLSKLFKSLLSIRSVILQIKALELYIMCNRPVIWSFEPLWKATQTLIRHPVKSTLTSEAEFAENNDTVMHKHCQHNISTTVGATFLVTIIQHQLFGSRYLQT